MRQQRSEIMSDGDEVDKDRMETIIHNVSSLNFEKFTAPPGARVKIAKKFILVS